MHKPWERFEVTGYSRHTPKFMGIVESVVIAAATAGLVTDAAVATAIVGFGEAAMTGAAIGAGVSAGTQLITTGKLDLGQMGESMGLGALTAGGLSGLGSAASALGLPALSSTAAGIVSPLANTLVKSTLGSSPTQRTATAPSSNALASNNMLSNSLSSGNLLSSATQDANAPRAIVNPRLYAPYNIFPRSQPWQTQPQLTL